MIEGIVKRAQKGCMPFCYCLRSFGSEMVSSSRSRIIGKEKTYWATIRGQEEEKDSKGEVHKKQKTSKPYTHFS